MDIETLKTEGERLALDQFGPAEALLLGLRLVDLAHGKPVAIDIRTANQCLFHVAMPGALPQNDNWARRKSNTAFYFQSASMLVTLMQRGKGRTDLSREGLPEADYALSGGAVPVSVKGAGMVAVATVSGLAEEEDHMLVIRALETML